MKGHFSIALFVFSSAAALLTALYLASAPDSKILVVDYIKSVASTAASNLNPTTADKINNFINSLVVVTKKATIQHHRDFDSEELVEMSIPRTIAKVVKAIEQSEGAGARVRRSIGTSAIRRFDPFLMLDHFNIGKGAGFPDHPHRGQSTITYMLSGHVDHEDFAGHKGSIGPGDLQWMVAGKGIVHAEMPSQTSDDPINGMQLWVDLPKAQKFCEPAYADIKAETIPAARPNDKVEIKVISGESHGVVSERELAYTPVWLLDVLVRPGGKVFQPLPRGFNAFAYTFKGSVNLSDGQETKKIDKFHIIVFGKDGKADGVGISVPEDAAEEARMIIVAGQPLEQEVVQYGPFVLNTENQIYEAMMDYQSHSNGFERAKGWRSEIGKSMMH